LKKKITPDKNSATGKDPKFISPSSEPSTEEQNEQESDSTLTGESAESTFTNALAPLSSEQTREYSSKHI